MPILALVVLFIAVPLTELWVILAVGDLIGPWLTIALLAADSVLGTVLLRTQGRAVWRQFNAALAEGRLPHREVQDGVCVVFGAAFLITPGFLTDIVGVVLLTPPTRALVRRYAGHLLVRRMEDRAARHRERPRARFDVEGTATDVPPPSPSRLER